MADDFTIFPGKEHDPGNEAIRRVPTPGAMGQDGCEFLGRLSLHIVSNNLAKQCNNFNDYRQIVAGHTIEGRGLRGRGGRGAGMLEKTGDGFPDEARLVETIRGG